MCLPTAPEHRGVPYAPKLDTALVYHIDVKWIGSGMVGTENAARAHRPIFMGFSVGGLHAVLWAEGVGSSPTKPNACNSGSSLPTLTVVSFEVNAIWQKSALRTYRSPIESGTISLKGSFGRLNHKSHANGGRSREERG